MATSLQLHESLPPREAWPALNERCPIFHSLELLSTRSAFLVLREAFYGATRFEQFVERAEISEPLAAARLKELTAAGLLEKVPYQEPGQRTRSEYHLTDKGAGLLPTIVALARWGDEWLDQARPLTRMTHVGCGGRVGAVLACEHGHQVRAAEVQLERRGSPRG